MPGYLYKILIIALLITIGLWLELAGLLDAQRLLSQLQPYAEHPALIVLLVLVQAILFSFALAGSFMLWIVAPLYPPPLATAILTLGATLGGLGAYFFSSFLGSDWIKRVENSSTYRLLHQQDNFFTLFALRVFPAFPHAVVNYSSGLLRVKLSHFIAAAILGIAIKSYLYCQAIYQAVQRSSTQESYLQLLDISIYAPLIVLSLLSFGGVLFRYWYQHRKR